jgi:hypothetical protein
LNVIIETLFLRRPRIDYQAPAVCEVQFSSTGSPIIVLEPIGHIHTPTGFVLGGRGHTFLNWQSVPGELCFSVYMSVDPTNPNSPFNIISECTDPFTIAICNPGCYKISANLRDGTETALSSPICAPGGSYIFIPLPRPPTAISYNLYKEADPNTPNGTYELYWGGFTGNAFELCAAGCYRVGVITTDGETQLSDATCIDNPTCQDPGCPAGQVWDGAICDCVVCPVQTCDPGFHWDAATCMCVSDGPPPGPTLAMYLTFDHAGDPHATGGGTPDGDLYMTDEVTGEKFYTVYNFGENPGVVNLPAGKIGNCFQEGADAFSAPGGPGGAIQLNSNDTSVFNFTAGSTPGFTIFGWLQMQFPAQNYPLRIGSLVSTDGQVNITLQYHNQAASWEFEVIDLTVGTSTLSQPDASPLGGGWFFAAATYDAVTGDMLLYINNNAPVSVAGIVAGHSFATGKFLIGTDDASGNSQVDEIGCSVNGVYSPARIAAIYNAGAGVTWPAVDSL